MTRTLYSRTHLSLHCPGSCLEIHDATSNIQPDAVPADTLRSDHLDHVILQHCPSFIPPWQFCVVYPASQHHSTVIMKSPGATTLFSEPFRGLSIALMESDTLKAVRWISGVVSRGLSCGTLTLILKRSTCEEGSTQWQVKKKCRSFSGLYFYSTKSELSHFGRKHLSCLWHWTEFKPKSSRFLIFGVGWALLNNHTHFQ